MLNQVQRSHDEFVCYFIMYMLTHELNLICDVWLFHYLARVILFFCVSFYAILHFLHVKEHKHSLSFIAYLLYMCLSIEVSLATTMLTFTFV